MPLAKIDWLSWFSPCSICTRHLSSSSPDHERTLLAHRIEAKDRQIDRLVYELYGLTEEEIEIVEAGAK